MRTTRLATACASMATRCQYQWERGTVHQGPINKHEQVSSDGYQMPLVGEAFGGPHVTCLDGGWGCVRPYASWVMVTWGPPMDRQTQTCENITFPPLRWRA